MGFIVKVKVIEKKRNRKTIWIRKLNFNKKSAITILTNNQIYAYYLANKYHVSH